MSWSVKNGNVRGNWKKKNVKIKVYDNGLGKILVNVIQINIS